MILRLALLPLILCAACAARADPAPAAALPDPLAAGWHGKPVCEVLRDDAQLRALRCTFPPGTGHERHWHAPHWGYILAGSTMRMTSASGTVTRELKPGASWWSDGIAWHEVENVGTTTGIYLIVEPRGAPPVAASGR